MLGLRRFVVLPSVACFGIAVLVLTIGLGGCASTVSSQAAGVGGPTPLDAEGGPAQVEPVRDVRQVPDDPAEPFSANFPVWLSGGRDPALSTAAHADAIIAAAITAHEMRKP